MCDRGNFILSLFQKPLRGFEGQGDRLLRRRRQEGQARQVRGIRREDEEGCQHCARRPREVRLSQTDLRERKREREREMTIMLQYTALYFLRLL